MTRRATSSTAVAAALCLAFTWACRSAASVIFDLPPPKPAPAAAPAAQGGAGAAAGPSYPEVGAGTAKYTLSKETNEFTQRVAIEEGIATFLAPNSAPDDVRYSAVYVRRDGKWLLAALNGSMLLLSLWTVIEGVAALLRPPRLDA